MLVWVWCLCGVQRQMIRKCLVAAKMKDSGPVRARWCGDAGRRGRGRESRYSDYPKGFMFQERTRLNPDDAGSVGSLCLKHGFLLVFFKLVKKISLYIFKCILFYLLTFIYFFIVYYYFVIYFDLCNISSWTLKISFWKLFRFSTSFWYKWLKHVEPTNVRYVH